MLHMGFYEQGDDTGTGAVITGFTGGTQKQMCHQPLKRRSLVFSEEEEGLDSTGTQNKGCCSDLLFKG